MKTNGSKTNKRNNRRRPRSSGPRNSISGVDRSVTITGKILVPIAQTATTSQTITVDPRSIDPTRLTALASGFEIFRFTNITLRLYPVANTSVPNGRTVMVMAYSKLDPVPPTGITDSYISPTSRYIDLFVTVPVSMRLPRADLLHSTNPWWSTQAATPNNIQGYIHFVCPEESFETAVEISYTVQFRTPTTTNDGLVSPLNSRLAPPKKPEKTEPFSLKIPTPEEVVAQQEKILADRIAYIKRVCSKGEIDAMVREFSRI